VEAGVDRHGDARFQRVAALSRDTVQLTQVQVAATLRQQ
jgi:hypothetical protein